jgi:DNA modification methylase
MISQVAAPRIEIWSIQKLVFYAKNPRKNDAAVDRMVASIREYGFKIPVLARSNGEVVDGHLRLKAAKKLGIFKIPVILCDEWSEPQVRAFRLMVNRSVGWAEWDDELLAQELADLRGLDFDLALTGFDDREIDDFLSDLGENDRADIIPPVPQQPASRLRDVWLLGTHRLICGDCTQPDIVANLLGSVKPELMVTDPPYGVGLEPEWREEAGLNPRTCQNGAVINDDQVDWSAAYARFPGDVAYVWHAGIHAGEVAAGLVSCGFQIRAQIIWKKQHFAISRGAYHWGHEPCYYAVRKGRTSHWSGDRTQSTVWEVPNLNPFGGDTARKENGVTGHGAQKPVELMRRPILNHTKRGASVYDPFLGSGTTLIAAELTGRTCFGIELDPKYVDVIIQRWQDFSGGEARLDGDGRTFAIVKTERLGVAA